MGQELTLAEQETKLSTLLSNEILQLLILPTEACNFRCTYCYEDHVQGKMQEKTVSALKQFLKNRLPTLRALTVSWFGGEPLLAKDIVLDISTFIQNEIIERGDFSYFASATTNGYLLDLSTLNDLVRVGVTEFQISLDGPSNIHNKRRLRVDGSGTFEQIWSNLINLRDSKLPVNVLLRIHIDAETRFQINPLLDLVRNELINDDRFTFFFRALSKLGGPNDHLLNVISDEEESTVIETLERFLGGGKFKHKSDFPMCYASHANSFVVRASGDFAKCTVALSDEHNKIGTLRSDGKLEIIPTRLTPWIRGIASLDSNELACPWRGFPGKYSR